MQHHPALAHPRRRAEALRIGGLLPLTTIDFPGRLAAVVFCQGCPWRCSYCHNSELLCATTEPRVSWQALMEFLERRRGLLDGVVFSGGEPTLQPALPAALAEVRALGFQTGLHTAGMYPQHLAEALPLLDWVGLDIKGPWHRIDEITAGREAAPRVQASLARLLASGVDYECRTTWDPHLFSAGELDGLAADLASRGVAHWALQRCRTTGPPGELPGPGQLAALGSRFATFSLRV